MEDHLEYEFKTAPFQHQQDVWNQTRDLEAFGIFWEQGTGKTKLAIDTMGHLALQNKVEAAVVVAPGGVARQWVVDALPAHMSNQLPIWPHWYQSERADTKWHQDAVSKLLSPRNPNFPILSLSYAAWMTKRGKQAVWDLLRKRRCMLVLDESAAIKTPSAKRTISIMAGSKYAPYRRIMSGTPIANSPFDAYKQIQVLDPAFWSREADIASYQAFKTFYGIWDKGYNRALEQEYDILVSYQNLDDLERLLSQITSRVQKDDVLDLPPKVYTKVYMVMTPEQRRIYSDIRDKFMTWLHSGELVTAQLAITRLIRFQQVLSGYIPTDDSDEPTELLGKNPRLDLLRETVEPISHKTIIWARFQHDVTQIMDALREMGRSPVRYDGMVSEAKRMEALDAFREGDATDFVSNAAAGGEGLDLWMARTVIYYNNSFNLVHRLQSEDRAHRHGQQFPVDIIDLVCPGTVDEGVLAALRDKRDIASIVLGDEVGAWI